MIQPQHKTSGVLRRVLLYIVQAPLSASADRAGADSPVLLGVSDGRHKPAGRSAARAQTAAPLAAVQRAGDALRRLLGSVAATLQLVHQLRPTGNAETGHGGQNWKQSRARDA